MGKPSRLFNLRAPSLKQRQRYAEFLERKVTQLQQLLMTIVKSEGSNLVDGRYTLIIPDKDGILPGQFDQFFIKYDEERKQTIITVEPVLPEDVKAQADALKAELAAAAGAPAEEVQA